MKSPKYKIGELLGATSFSNKDLVLGQIEKIYEEDNVFMYKVYWFNNGYVTSYDELQIETYRLYLKSKKGF